MVYQRRNFKFGGLIMYSVIEKDEDHILLEFYGGGENPQCPPPGQAPVPRRSNGAGKNRRKEKQPP